MPLGCNSCKPMVCEKRISGKMGGKVSEYLDHKICEGHKEIELPLTYSCMISRAKYGSEKELNRVEKTHLYEKSGKI